MFIKKGFKKKENNYVFLSFQFIHYFQLVYKYLALGKIFSKIFLLEKGISPLFFYFYFFLYIYSKRKIRRAAAASYKITLK